MAKVLVGSTARINQLANAIAYTQRAGAPGRGTPSTNNGGLLDAIPFYNDSGETIPAYAVMKLHATRWEGERLILDMKKPDATFQRLWYVNSGQEVESQKYGGCFTLTTDREFVRPVLYNDADQPALGEQWGAACGSWLLTKNRYGFSVYGTNGNTLITDDILFARQREVLTVECALNASIAGSASAAARILFNGSSTGHTIAVSAPSFADTDNIAVNTELVAAWIDKWRIIGEGCNA